MPLDGRLPLSLARDRRGAVGVVFALLAPLLVLVAAVAMERVGAARETLHLQGLADRAALSAAPLWAAGDRSRAVAVAAALVAADGTGAQLHYAGPAGEGRWAMVPEAMEIRVSGRERRLLGDVPGADRPWARTVAIKTRRVS